MLDVVNKLLNTKHTKRLLTIPRNILSLHLKQTFPPIIRIFAKGEGDEIESRLPFKIFSTLSLTLKFTITIQDFFQILYAYEN